MENALAGPRTHHKCCWVAPWKVAGLEFGAHAAHRWTRGFRTPIAIASASLKAQAPQVGD